MDVLKSILNCFLCLYIIVLPLIPNNSLIIRGKSISGDIFLGLAIIVYLIQIIFFSRTRERFIRGIKDFFTDYLGIFLALMSALMLFSVTYAFDKRIAVSESVRFITYVILFFIIKYECNSKKNLNMFMNAYLIVCTCVCLFGIVQYFTGIGLSDVFKNYSYTRAKIDSTLDNPNNLAAFTILAIFPLIMVSIREKVKGKKILYVFITLLVFINMVLTFSRNIILGFGVGLCVLVLIYSWKFILAIIASGGVAMLVPQINSRIMALSDPEQNMSRILLWKVALKMIKDRPILGVGNGNYVSLYPEYVKKYPELAYYRWTTSASHNSYIKVQTELGVLGSFAFAGVIIGSILKIREAVRIINDNYYRAFYIGFFSSVIAFLVMNLADNLFFVPKTTAFFWILISIAEAHIYRIKNGYKESRLWM